MLRKKLPMLFALACAVSVFGCRNNDDASHAQINPSSSAATASAPAAAAGQLSFGSTTLEVKTTSHPVGVAHAYLSGADDDRKLEIRLFSDTIRGAKDCGYEVESTGKAITSDQLALTIEADGLERGPVTADDANYTIYFRDAGAKEGTNSGDSRGSKLVVTEWTDSVVKGKYEVHGGMEIAATFVAPICKE